MTTLIQCTDIGHSAGTKPLFSGLDLTIDSGARIGLVGHNGAGKSTLLALLSQAQLPDRGDISRANDLRLEVVEQFIDPRLYSLSLAEALTDKLPVDEQLFGSYKVERQLQQLGFDASEFDHQVQHLSGGQQNRLMFARAIINEPNLVLFDEPTNHLDLSTLLFFENFFASFNAAYLLISHDRQFLDGVTNSTVILRDQKAYHFALPFSEARQRLAEQDEAAAARRKEEEKALKSLKASQKRMAEWGKVYDNEKLARKAKSMEKRIVKLEADKTFVSRGSGLNLTLDLETSRASRMLQIEGRDILAPGDGGRVLLHVEDFYIRPGDRVALLGSNGVGKTTLIHRLMASFAAQDQFIKFNPQCDIGYYDQEMAQLVPARTLLETLRDQCRRTEQDYSAGLIQSGFPYADFSKQVNVLSGGEKARLLFLILKLNQPNFLIMDEPTNHIDIQGKEELEAQLLGSQATLLVTSHDRRFVDHIAQRFLMIDEGQLLEINDPQVFYARQQQQQQPQPPASSDVAPAAPPTPADLSEDELLQRLVTIEALLEEDQARKPRFQKPKMQAQWQTEIDQITSLLG